MVIHGIITLEGNKTTEKKSFSSIRNDHPLCSTKRISIREMPPNKPYRLEEKYRLAKTLANIKTLDHQGKALATLAINASPWIIKLSSKRYLERPKLTWRNRADLFDNID